jgi:hypothetical protein
VPLQYRWWTWWWTAALSLSNPASRLRRRRDFTLSLAKQVLSGQMDEVIETIEHNSAFYDPAVTRPGAIRDTAKS